MEEITATSLATQVAFKSEGKLRGTQEGELIGSPNESLTCSAILTRNYPSEVADIKHALYITAEHSTYQSPTH